MRRFAFSGRIHWVLKGFRRRRFPRLDAADAGGQHDRTPVERGDRTTGAQGMGKRGADGDRSDEHADSEPAVGQDVFHASDTEQPCGTVAQVAANPAGGFDAIVSMQISAADGQALTLGAPDGARLTLLPLPYELLADI